MRPPAEAAAAGSHHPAGHHSRHQVSGYIIIIIFIIIIIVIIIIITIITIIPRYREGVEAVEAAFLTFVDTSDRLEDKVEEFRSHKGTVINDVIGFVKQKQKYVLVL